MEEQNKRQRELELEEIIKYAKQFGLKKLNKQFKNYYIGQYTKNPERAYEATKRYIEGRASKLRKSE